ncbi:MULTISPECIES: glycoside hydrolase family protein [unclassified Caballeronia]|uniref:glycoside hydrolase family protein n=1 Tax=unclassified Caballeronia TaxID=2646786 RepID=UPI00285AB619|nr:MULTISPECIES: glycoside hydrolase family protein [unclassified Caballeronia]MDR5772071.1 glycoside hydrolase family protein [Caballeronia sp. LZ002]MDR5847505.1 glycoside hydrolase family protein [Caballeronia sp. LZ003]
MNATYDRQALEAELTRDEDNVPYAYQDSLGYLTIGIGHLIDKRKGGKLRPEVIDLIFELDIQDVEADLDRNLTWWRNLSPVRQRVLLNMCFNMGIGTLLTFKNTLVAMQNGSYAAAAAGMLASRWATQVGDRAERLAEMMRSGVAP